MPRAYSPGHEPILRQVLHRLGFWEHADQPLPDPEELRHGVAGQSTIYLLYLPAGTDSGRYFAVKFDQLARSHREWQAVEQLRTLDSPPEILLPLPGNVPADGVMVFQAAEAIAGTLRCVTLLQYLRQQIAGNPENCRTALTKTFEVLGAYYEIAPGAHRLVQGSRLLRWEGVYGDQLSDAAIRGAKATAARHWAGIDWESAPTFPAPGHLGTDRPTLPNPFPRLRPLLLEATGRVMLSRIHGDLNLTNVIVGQRQDTSIDRILVFDLANSQPDRVQAIDSSRLEAEIWRRVFVGPTTGDTENELRAARDVLDGRLAEISTNFSATARGCVLLVDHLRELAKGRLAPRPPGATYLLNDHLQALYFTCLSMLKHPDVAASRDRSRIMLLSSALSLAFLEDVERGLYAPGSLIRRWSPPRGFAESGRVQASAAPEADHLAIFQRGQQALRQELPPAALHQLPLAPPDFTGRRAELRALRAGLAAAGDGQAGLGIFGAGGTGKTDLALSFAAEVAPRYPDAQIYLDLQGLTTPLSVSDARAFIIWSFFPEMQVPGRDTESTALYRHVLHGRRVLLLLDNAAGPEQVAPLIPATGSLLLVTSRTHFALPGLVPLLLGQLPRQDARRLLLRICPRISRAAGELATLCGGLPLALRVVGSTLLSRPDLSPSEYARHLAEGRERLEPVEAALELSWRRLPLELQRLWLLLSVFPLTFNARAAAAVWQLDQRTSEEALGQLLVQSLIECPSSRRYRLHDLTRALADERLDSANRSLAASRHASYYLYLLAIAKGLYYLGGSNGLVGLQVFDLEWPNIRTGQLWACSQPPDDFAAAGLCSSYSAESEIFLYLRLTHQERLRWHQPALEAARRRGDRAAEGLHLGQLGIDHRDAAESTAAIEFLEQQLEIARERNDQGSALEALTNLGAVYLEWGRPDPAFDFFNRALSQARERDREHAEGIILHNLAKIHERRGELAQAEEFYQQDLAIAREGGYIAHIAHSFISLAGVRTAMGEPRIATQYLETALSIARAIHDRRTEASALTALGMALRALNEPGPATQQLRQAIAIARERSDLSAESWASWQLGLLHEEQGDLVSAIACMQITVDLERRTGHGDADRDAAQLEAVRARLAALPSPPSSSP
jgi:tetratricopeptide (TPR) repeat protein